MSEKHVGQPRLITVSSKARVLVVEDSEARIKRFRECIKAETTYCTTAQEALEELKNGVPFNVIFLDYDSGPDFWQPWESDRNTFYSVVRRLEELRYSEDAILHTLNPAGAQRMRMALERTARVTVVPFHSLELRTL